MGLRIFVLVAEPLEEGGVFPVEAPGGPLLAWVGLGLSTRVSKKSKHLQKLNANLQAQMLPVQDMWYLFYPTDDPLLLLAGCTSSSLWSAPSHIQVLEQRPVFRSLLVFRPLLRRCLEASEKAEYRITYQNPNVQLSPSTGSVVPGPPLSWPTSVIEIYVHAK